jgi:hypothetical protein
MPGSPDIVETILKKIENSDVFVCDITPVLFMENGKGFPNPNVLIELGYAGKVLGWNNIICICNSGISEIESLPFDIRQKRITTYNLKPGGQKKNEKINLKRILTTALSLISENQTLNDKVTSLLKKRIDNLLIKLIKQFNLYSHINGFDRLLSFLSEMEELDKKDGLNSNEIEFLNNTIKELANIVKDPLLIVNQKIPVDKIITISNLIDELELLRDKLTNIDKSESVKDTMIYNYMEVSKLINEIIEQWGNEILMDPARI